MHPAVDPVLAVDVPIVQVVDVIGVDHRIVTAARSVRVLVGLGGRVLGGRGHLVLLLESGEHMQAIIYTHIRMSTRSVRRGCGAVSTCSGAIFALSGPPDGQ